MKTALQVYLEHEYGISFSTPSELKRKLRELWEKDPERFGELITELKRIGDRIATEKGFTIRYEDLKPVDRYKPKKDLGAEEAAKLQQELPKKLVEELAQKGNSFAYMIKSKARGKPNQLLQMLVSPIMFSDAKGRPFPFTIKRSFAEGLSPEEYFAASVGARKGIVMTQLATSEPGALSKELLANVADLVVTEIDCGTKKGMRFPIDSDFVLDRYLAHDHGRWKRNTLVTPEVRDAMKKEGWKELEVRTPLTCLAKDGVCAYCLGPVGDRKLPEIGFNAGVTAGQTITEPLTQFVLSFKHTGGLVGAGDNAFEQVKRVLHAPKSFKGKAVLAQKSGTVTKIEKSPVGGHFIYVGNVEHYIPSGQEPTVKVGDRVEVGDILSTGIASPREIAEKKGLHAARQYIATALHQIYERQGIDIHPKAFEAVARAITKYVKVEDPGETPLAKGEILDYDALKRYLGSFVKTVPRSKAVGKPLARNYGPYGAGEKVTREMLKNLPQRVEVIEAEGLKLTPYIPPLQKAHLYTNDWLVGMSRSELKRVLLEGAWHGKVSKYRWYHPLPAWVQGATFGQGERGAY